MTKILLIGEINETLQSINECLMPYFQIQMCSENAKNVKDMIRILRPALLIFNVQDADGDVMDVFEALDIKYDHISMLVIGTKDMEQKLQPALERFRNVSMIYRPLKSKDVLNMCFSILHMEMPVQKETLKGAEVKKSILIIDDNALVLRNLKSILEKEYKVMLANSGEKGLEFIKTKNPDVILLDYDMPGMNGLEVFEKIREDESINKIPVVFLTSVAERELILKVLRNRPDGYILKPPSREKIVEVINEALNKE